MQLHGELHAGKGADDTVYAASLGREVPDGPRMAEVILMHQGAGERHGKSGMLSGDHWLCSERFLCCDVNLGCQKLLQTGSFQLLHLKKFHPELEFHGPLDCGSLNGDGGSLFRNLELHGEEGASLYREIADDLAATHPEVVYDRYPGMIACESSREFHLIANVLPLLRHSGAIRGIRFIRGPGDEAPTDYALASGKANR